jgi:hypothetical protein
MVKKSIIAIVIIFLFSVLAVGAATKWGYTRYGAVYYYGEPFYSYYPVQQYSYPYYNNAYYRYPAYAYPYYNRGPLASDFMYRYGTPTVTVGAPAMSYPASAGVQMPTRGVQGQLCGLVDSQQFGCDFGLVCDYTKTGQSGVGICSMPSGAYASTSYPYYYS